ncbi:MAG: hypothetical protein JRN54_01780, partial [Nitrososphaerota archaeon]|nr:hypothetical protein [Nitrososphaerota archaeon]
MVIVLLNFLPFGLNILQLRGTLNLTVVPLVFTHVFCFPQVQFFPPLNGVGFFADNGEPATARRRGPV